jgi:hypothetical protein
MCIRKFKSGGKIVIFELLKMKVQFPKLDRDRRLINTYLVVHMHIWGSSEVVKK